MKIKLTLLTFLLIAFSALSQSNPEEKVKEYLTPERYNKLKEKQSVYIDQLISKVQFGFSIDEFETEKLEGFSQVLEVTKTNPYSKEKTTISIEEFLEEYNDPDFNILLYEFPGKRQSNTYYRLGNTNKVLSIYSIEFILSKI